MKSLVVGALLLFCGVARATMLAPLDTKALTTRADRVVLGVVESQVSRWTDDHQAIYTDATIRVTKSYKGGVAPGQTLVVRREGGAVDGIGMRVYGAAVFTVGEEVLVFAETRGGATDTVGMTQGKLHVSVAADGTKQVAANLGEVAFTRANARVVVGPRRLDDLEREIMSYVRK